MPKIQTTYCGFLREPLRAPFGFKGGTLSELWQVVARINLDTGEQGMGIGVQSVLWSDAKTFCAYNEMQGNEKMFSVTYKALTILHGMEFTTPPQIIKCIFPTLCQYASEILGRKDVPQTFVLNALVAVDFALWQLWAKTNTKDTFAQITQKFCAQYSENQPALLNVPLITYNMTNNALIELLNNGSALLKIKIGSDPNKDGDYNAMLKWDIARVSQIHEIAKTYKTPYTECGAPVYYLDANGRYPNKDYLVQFLNAMREIGALERIVLLEEPFAENNLIYVGDLPVCIVGDESAHSARDVVKLIKEYGYGAIALKPIAKTLSVSFDMLQVVKENDAVCFCADLTVPPVMLDWNISVAACLPLIPGLKIGVVESNGAQNYKDWQKLQEMCAIENASWRVCENGVYNLNKEFYQKNGIFELLPKYAECLKPVI